jgi:hypothetical protein
MNPKEKEEIDARLRIATETLYDDYKNDKELTAFTVLDGGDVWEDLPEYQKSET